MIYNLHCVMPFGNRSRGYSFDTLDKAMKGFERYKNQIITNEEGIKVVLEDEEGNVIREEQIGG